MSQEVDERVVEMRFDNAQFEKNVHQTMQSLEKLNDSLRLDGAEKGFEKIGDASAKVDFDEMQGALDDLSGKFSAVEVMGVAALSHITRQAVDTGEKLVKSLSLDQVTSGWNKYAQKTASVQTIMNATGKSIAKVNGYLSKLMWFSDETSYSFTDMTQSLGQLTASGGDIEKVIPMIMGMANATAYAGKGASEFSRVIYNLNQSYSQGYLSLMDWKSVELAGVATAELKKQIIETGVALGKIKEGAVTVGTFGSTLSKKWADKEVMETAFGKFAEFSEAVKKMVDANPGMLASQAIDALADKYDEVTVKAFKAAQEAKSFSEAVDATKDAVSSGWMETFDILFGNYEEAKGFWSDLAEEFWNMFAGGAAGRNNWLKNAFDSGLDQLLGTEGFGDAGDNYTNLLQKALVNQGLLSEEGIEEAGSFQKALEESGVTAQQLYEVLGEAAEHYHQRAAMSDEELNKLGFDRDKVDALANAYDSLAGQIQNGSVNLDDLAGKMNQLSGREHFFNGILNVLEGINSVLSPIRDGFGDVFMTDGSPLYNFLKGFDELSGKMALSEETAEKVQKVFTGVFRVLSIGLKGVKTVGKTAFMILGKLLDLLSPMGDLLLNIGSCIGNLLTWVDESLGQAESLSDVLGILVGAVAALVSPIADVVKGVKALVRGGSMEEAKKQFGAFGTVVDAVGSVLDKFKIGSVSAGNVIGTAFQLLGGILLGAFEGMGALIGRAFNGFKGAGDTVSEFADSKVPLLENIRDVVLSLPEKAEKALADFGGTLTGIMSNISGACRNALSAVKDFFNLQDGVDLYRLLALIDVGALAAAIYGVTVLLKKASNNFKKTLANPIGDFFKSLTGAVNTWTKANTTNNLATAAKAIATAVALISGSMYLLAKINDPTRAVQALASVISELFSMVVALKVLAATDLTGLDTAKLIGTVVAISIGMAALTNTVAKLGKMDAAQAEKSVEAVGHIAAMLAGMTGLLALFNKQLGGVKGAGGFVAAAAAVDMIALALIPLAKAEANGLDIDGAVEAINGVAIAMSILTVAAGFAQKLAGKADVGTLDKIIKYLVKLGGMLVAINAVGTALLMAAGAVAIISGSMYLLAKINDPTRAVQALASVISELFSMVVALKVLAATDLTGLDTAKLIGTVVAISIGMAALTNTVAKLGKMDAAQAEKSVEAVGHIAAMLAGMTGLLALFNKQLGGVKGAGGFVAAAAAVDMIALALIPLAKAEANGLDIDGAVEAINGVAIAMSILTVAAGFAQKLAGKADVGTLDKIIKYLVKLGGMLVAINAVGTALLMAAGAVAIFASLGDRMMDGIRGAGLVVSGIAALLVLMANTKVNPLRMKMGAESMVIASASLLVMAAAIKQMGKAMGTDTGGAGMAGVSLMLVELAGALYLLGKQAPESTAAAVAMVAMGAAMIEMAMAIKMLADVDFADIVKSMLGLAAALGVLIAVCWGLGFVSANLASAAGACLMLATALLILTPAFKGLASLTAGEAFAGVIGTIGIMLGLFAVGAITPVAAGMVVFSACLISLGKAFSAFAGGIIKLSIAAAILTVLSAFAGPLREVIVNAADDIEAALTAILTAICNTINNCAEPIGAALLTLCKVLIQTVIDLIGWAWSGEGGEGNGIEGALEELWSQFVEWLGEKKDEAGELIGKQLNPANWFTVKGGLLGSLLDSADTAADEREMTEYGTYMAEGLANGLTGPESTNAVTGGIATLCSTVETFFRNFWGIHSPSTRMATLSEYIPEGFKEGLTGTDGTAAIGDGISGMLDSAGSWLDKLFPGLLNKAKNYGSQFQNALLSGSEYQGMPGFDEWYEKEISAYRAKQPGGKTGLTAEDLDADIKKDPKDAKNPTGSGGKTKKSSGSGTKKTVAQQIEEKYKPKLEANKAAREALDSEYELWQTENQYSADEDTLLSKKMENAAAEIANQTDRVAIAQAKYDEMLKRWGADKTETKEAYASLLSEKTSLAKLQADQYTGLFEDITKRYDTDLGTLEKEYNLWTAQNSNTASKLDKIDRETEYQKDELELKQKKEAKAKEQWETLRKEYGESDLRTKEAWNDYLDAQTESLQLQNDIAKQSLNKLDAQLSIIKDEQSRMQSRMDLLTSIYGDGSLKDREDAYKQAVEQYGENSAEARKAKYQGITTSILGTVEALQNMNAELEKTRLIQQQLADGKDLNGNPLSKDDVNDLKDQLLSSRSSMVSFAGALADAMGLEDSAKSAVVKLANAIQKNWVPISNAYSEVWTKVSGAMGEEMTNTLSTVFKAAFSEEGMEIGTEFVSAIASAMQGDYAGAIISAATGLIDLLFTDTGKQLTGGAGDMLLKLFSGIQNGDLAGKLANIGTAAANVGNSLSGLLPMLGQLGTTGAGAGMAVGGIGEALGGLGASILAVLPELLIVVGIIAAIAALIGGIAWFISSRKKEKATGAKDVGSEIDKGISDGVKEDAPIVDDAVSDMTENAMDIAKGTLGTISKVMGDDYEYTPQIVPVVDLTNVLEGADEIDNAFAATKSLSLDGDVSRNLADKIDAEVQLQNGLKSAGNEDTLRAINALAGHMDGVAESIKGMSVTINGRKAIGYIDDRMGRLTAAKVK